MSQIVVNATAARTSGALSILNQFINHIPQESFDIYYIFVDAGYSQIPVNNVVYIKVDTGSWAKRIRWDGYGLKNWIKRNNIYPSLIISLQNTGVKFDKRIPQLVYYHQPLTLASNVWHWYKREELLFFIYKHFYSYFVSRYIHSNTSFVVQIPSIKELFLKKFPIKEENVHVIPPEFHCENINECQEPNDDYIHFVYPATPFLYKNHSVLLAALYYLKINEAEIYGRIKLHLTLPERNALNKKIDALGIKDAIVFEGVVPYLKLLSYYQTMQALLFPSYIESFGLPLLEAASTGMSIVAADLPYVHDVIGDYDGVKFVDYKDEKAWASAMKGVFYDQKRNLPYKYKNKCGWSDFFALIERLKIK